MNVVPKLAKRIVDVLLAVALALSPVAALAGQDHMPKTSHSASLDRSSPCDMPCGGCDEGISKSFCMLACLGLNTAVAPVAIAAMPVILAIRIEAQSNIVLAGRDREPDKPPPKSILA